MAVRKTFTVSVTPEQDAFIRDRLRSGRFSSVSEVMRASLRLLERDEATISDPASTPETPNKVQSSV